MATTERMYHTIDRDEEMTVSEAADKFGVSNSCARRSLNYLARCDVVEKRGHVRPIVFIGKQARIK